MAATDLNLVFAKLCPASTWLLSSAIPPHTLIEWRGPETEPTQQEIDDEWVIIEAEDAAQAANESSAQNDYDAAKAAWSSMPDWCKTYTDAQVDAWIDDNVTDMASAKTAMASIAKTMRKLIDLSKFNYLS